MGDTLCNICPGRPLGAAWCPLALPPCRPRAAEPPLPGLATQVVNITAATARDVAHGFARLDADAVAARLAVCLEGAGLPPEATRDGHCDRYRPGDGRCSRCGCYLEGVDAKAARPHERCPLGRWPGETTR